MQSSKISIFIMIMFYLVSGIFSFNVAYAAGTRFKNNWREESGTNTGTASCQDIRKSCVESGYRTIEGIREYRSCWRYSYEKRCTYPSKNDCSIYDHCYPVADRECLVRDSYGNCVNIIREFTCKSWEVMNKENKTVRQGLVEKDSPEGLVCNGIPCIDGNCVDKSYETNGEMMDSVSRLYAAKMCKPDKEGNFDLFKGTNMHCSKKPLGNKNCCGIGEKGWGSELGVKCTQDERLLQQKRQKNLCIGVGKVTTGTKPAHVNKHYFCCFGNMLDKVIQIQGRAQLGKNFGTGERPDCRGLTLEEIQKIDFNKIDFTEFIEDFKVKFANSYKAESIDDVKARMKKGKSGIKRGDHNASDPSNNSSGWHESNKVDKDAVRVE